MWTIQSVISVGYPACNNGLNQITSKIVTGHHMIPTAGKNLGKKDYKTLF